MFSVEGTNRPLGDTIATGDEPLRRGLGSFVRTGRHVWIRSLVSVRSWRGIFVPIALASVGAGFYSGVSIFRHDRFGSYGFDLGIFDQTIWGYSHFAIITNTIKNTHDLLGDHFHPILMLLAPAYWVWDDVRVLLVVQALLLALGSIPVFLWTREKLGMVEAILMQLAFLLFWGLLAGMIFDFHELAVAVPALSFGTYALLKRQNIMFVCMLVIGCLTKEDIALTFLAMGLYMVIVQRRGRVGLIITAAAATWFGLTIEVIMPAISGHSYTYWNYGNLGPTPGRALEALAERPYRAVTLLFNRSEKVRTIVELFGAWLFLPLLSPLLLLSVPTLIERFWSTNSGLWSTSAQYSLPLAPLLAFAAADGVRRLKDRFPGAGPSISRLICAAVLAAGLSIVIWSVRPLRGVSSYMSSSRASEIDSCLRRIPSGASVAASNQLVPHLTHRRHIYRLFARSGQEYLAVMDNTPQGRNVLRWSESGLPVQPENVAYRPVCQRGGVTILVRAAS